MIEEVFLDDFNDLVSVLTEEIAKQLGLAVQTKGHALFLVSGGSSPRPVYEALSEQDIPWSNVTVALVDERCVPVDHLASNERFIRESLLKGAASGATFLGMKAEQSTAALNLPACKADYDELSDCADVCLLGMGVDGHTASLFPGATGSEYALSTRERCAVIEAMPSDVTGEYTQRITLTPSYLLAVKNRFLMITGDKKMQVYRQALKPGEVSEMPIRSVLTADEMTRVYWAP